MAFKSSKGRDVGKEVETWQSKREVLGKDAGQGSGEFPSLRGDLVLTPDPVNARDTVTASGGSFSGEIQGPAQYQFSRNGFDTGEWQTSNQFTVPDIYSGTLFCQKRVFDSGALVYTNEIRNTVAIAQTAGVADMKILTITGSDSTNYSAPTAPNYAASAVPATIISDSSVTGTPGLTTSLTSSVSGPNTNIQVNAECISDGSVIYAITGSSGSFENESAYTFDLSDIGASSTAAATLFTQPATLSGTLSVGVSTFVANNAGSFSEAIFEASPQEDFSAGIVTSTFSNNSTAYAIGITTDPGPFYVRGKYVSTTDESPLSLTVKSARGNSGASNYIVRSVDGYSGTLINFYSPDIEPTETGTYLVAHSLSSQSAKLSVGGPAGGFGNSGATGCPTQPPFQNGGKTPYFAMLCVRQRSTWNVDSVGPSGEITSISANNQAKGLPLYWTTRNWTVPASQGNGTGAQMQLRQDVDGYTIISAIAQGGSGYQVGDTIEWFEIPGPMCPSSSTSFQDDSTKIWTPDEGENTFENVTTPQQHEDVENDILLHIIGGLGGSASSYFGCGVNRNCSTNFADRSSFDSESGATGTFPLQNGGGGSAGGNGGSGGGGGAGSPSGPGGGGGTSNCGSGTAGKRFRSSLLDGYTTDNVPGTAGIEVSTPFGTFEVPEDRTFAIKLN